MSYLEFERVSKSWYCIPLISYIITFYHLKQNETQMDKNMNKLMATKRKAHPYNLILFLAVRKKSINQSSFTRICSWEDKTNRATKWKMFAIRKVHFLCYDNAQRRYAKFIYKAYTQLCTYYLLENNYIFIIKNEMHNMLYLLSNMLHISAYLYATWK